MPHYDNGMRQEYNLSLQGGNAKTTHFYHWDI